MDKTPIIESRRVQQADKQFTESAAAPPAAVKSTTQDTWE